MAKRSKLEQQFITLWEHYYPELELAEELVYIPGRKFRLDFAHVESKVGIEINGAIWTKGGHSSGKGLMRDAEKQNLGLLAGWQVFTLAGKDMISRRWVDLISGQIEERLRQNGA
tara:strand:- start:171 stop:515 length:345 start_codon:yes stop_codon:yes gene_type:complete